jgi:hypothetical protein
MSKTEGNFHIEKCKARLPAHILSAFLLALNKPNVGSEYRSEDRSRLEGCQKFRRDIRKTIGSLQTLNENKIDGQFML